MAQQATTPTTAQPQQATLTLACSHEHQSLNRYRMMSLRFLPYSLALSRLFEAFANESEQRIQALMQMAKHLQATGDLPAAIPPSHSEGDQEKRHFFVIGDAMAGAVVADGLLREHQSTLFYRQLYHIYHANCLPELTGLLLTFAEQKHAECRVLQESQGYLLPESQGYLLPDGCLSGRQQVA